MSQQTAGRIENLGVLLAAMFSVVIGGSMPFAQGLEEIEPLRVEFSDICRGKKWHRWFWQECGIDGPALKNLINMRHMPSTLRSAVREELYSRGLPAETPLRTFDGRELARSVAASNGVELGLLFWCWECPVEDLDAIWHSCRSVFLRLQRGELTRDRSILTHFCTDSDVEMALGLDSGYVRDVKEGWIIDPRTRAALRCAQSAATLSARTNSGPSGNRWPKRSDVEAALKPFTDTQSLVSPSTGSPALEKELAEVAL